VATDDERIRDCVQGFGGQAVMTREDHPSGSDRLAEAAELLGLDGEDIVINIQGDQAVFPPLLVRHLAALLEKD
jgi:3-deoxy-manno-octulosonate cytidylyltransferase (CMP-KDO synthetase)